MTRRLDDTNSAQIANAFIDARNEAGSPVMGMVMTLIVVVPEADADAAIAAAREASHSHPSRLLGVVLGDGRGAGHVDAEVGIGRDGAGEVAVIRLRGEVTKHAASVVLPLLLPDSPAVVWWPTDAPDDPAADPVGRLAQRRITDSAGATRAPTKAVERRCASYAPGDTDLAWARLTPWRALLVAALEQQRATVRRAAVSAERSNPSADLLVAWLTDRLKVSVDLVASEGPGITEVTLTTADGDISISRPDGRRARLEAPGQPARSVALPRRTLPDLLAEDLRRLDEDDVYAATTRRLVRMRS